MPRRLTVTSAVLFTLCAATPAAAQVGACGTLWSLDLNPDPLAFGTYIPSSGSPATANSRVVVACGAGEILSVYLPSFTIALSAGSGGSAYSPRRMSNGTYRLNYNLYTTASYAVVWGDGTGGTQTQGYSASLFQRSAAFTVYGRVPASQTSAAAGAFADTITVTITY